MDFTTITYTHRGAACSMTIDYRWRAHYEPDVVPTIPISDQTLPQLLAATAAQYPSHVAVRMVLRYLPLGLRIEAKLTYAQLDRLSDRFAAALAGLGIGKGAVSYTHLDVYKRQSTACSNFNPMRLRLCAA